MATQTYMTAKLNLADGTIVYPQISLDNIVKSISDPTLVAVAQLDASSKVSISNLPVTTSVTNSNSTVPTNGAVYGALNTKQATLVEGDNIIHIINGSTIMADITNLDVAGIDQTATNGVHLVLSGGNTISAAVELAGATAGVPGTVMGATNGVTLDGGVVTGLFGDGMEVVGGTAKADIATVAETLNGTAGSNMVDADGLKGAMSLGQAVDVSCPALWSNAASYYILLPDDATQYTCDSDKYKDGGYLNSFKVVFSGANTDVTIGFSSNDSKGFPKWATGLYYLYIADIKNSGQVDLSNCYFYAGSNIDIAGTSRFLPAAARTKGQTTYTRIAVLTTSASCSIHFIKAANATVQIEIMNWRQYEVTNLTDEAIQYLAAGETNPNPDDLFRSSNFFAISGRYMIKSDMVSPWTYLITMPANSPAVTIGSGLAYQISLTDGQQHEITVDTFPTNAYGADSHVQLLLANNSTVVFKEPLHLIDHLTDNAAHNITVKFRAGQANVYVDDMDAGYIVTVSAGTESGSLYLGITGSTAEYIIFSPDINGSTITEIPPIARQVNIVGNGQENTIFSPDSNPLSIAQGGNLAHLTVKDMVLGDTTAIAAYAATNKQLTIDDVLITGITTGNKVPIYLGGTWDSVTVVSNCTITGVTTTNWQIVSTLNGKYRFENCKVVDNIANSDVLICYTGSGVSITNCLFDNTSVLAVFVHSATPVLISGSTFAKEDDAIGFYTTTGYVVFSGTNVLNTSVKAANVHATEQTGPVFLADGAILDLSGSSVDPTIYTSKPTTANIVGTTICVVNSPDDRTIGGTATVLYNAALDGETGVKARTISGGGSDYIMRANGGMGVPVTTTTAESTGSLDTLLADATIEQITFAPVVDVTTPTTGGTCYVGVTSGATASVTGDFLAINGAGISKTKIGAGALAVDATKLYYQYVKLSGFEATDFIAPRGDWNKYKFLEAEHCLLKGDSAFTGERVATITGCTFSNITQVYAIKTGWSFVKDCVFDTCSGGIHTCYPGDYQEPNPTTATGQQFIKNCSFSNMSGFGIRFYYTGNVIVEGCEFTNCNKCLTSYTIDNTYAGAFHPVIKNCVFNTATDVISLWTKQEGSYFTIQDCVVKCNIINNYVTDLSQNGKFNVELTGNTFSGNITSQLAEDTITFVGTNVLSGTVSGEGTVIIGGTACSLAGTSAQHGSIATTFVQYATTTPADTTFNYIDITGSTVQLDKTTTSNLTITNCVWSNIVAGNPSAAILNRSGTVRITGSTLTSSATTSLYNYGGVSIIQDSILRNISMYTGTVVIKGTVFSGQAYWPVSTSGTVKCVFTKGSTVKAGYGYGQAGAQAQFIVGTYNESTGAITEEGTATLIVGDTTVSISGHGNGYDSTGLHTK